MKSEDIYIYIYSYIQYNDNSPSQVGAVEDHVPSSPQVLVIEPFSV